MVLRKRHILKTITYRLLSSTVGVVTAWIITDSWKISLTLSLAELVYKPLQYYFHERIWYKWIKLGLKKEEDG